MLFRITYIVEAEDKYFDTFRKAVCDNDLWLHEHYECGLTSGMWMSEYTSKEVCIELNDMVQDIIKENGLEGLVKYDIEDKEGRYYDNFNEIA